MKKSELLKENERLLKENEMRKKDIEGLLRENGELFCKIRDLNGEQSNLELELKRAHEKIDNYKKYVEIPLPEGCIKGVYCRSCVHCGVARPDPFEEQIIYCKKDMNCKHFVKVQGD